MVASVGSWMGMWQGIRELRGLFGGAAESPLTQQTTSEIIPTLDDEAVRAALLAALYHLPKIGEIEGPERVKLLERLFSSLEMHQVDRFGKILAKIELTEHFEDFIASETFEKYGWPSQEADPQDSQDPQAQSMRRRQQQQKGGKGGTSIIEKNQIQRQRVKKDYEYTKDDPRLNVLVTLSDIVHASGVETAKAWLIMNNFIHEQSVAQKLKDGAVKAKDSAVSGIYHAITSLQLGPYYGLIMQYATVAEIPGEKPEDHAKRLATEVEKRFEYTYYRLFAEKRERIRKHKQAFSVSTWLLMLLTGVVLVAAYIIVSSK